MHRALPKLSHGVYGHIRSSDHPVHVRCSVIGREIPSYTRGTCGAKDADLVCSNSGVVEITSERSGDRIIEPNSIQKRRIPRHVKRIPGWPAAIAFPDTGLTSHEDLLCYR